jgi:hypothetical protein
MLEKWGNKTPYLLSQLINPFCAPPYLLFYLGILLRYRFGNSPNSLTAARIIMAFDLELWYLRSLKFVIALRFLGPKLFMLKNMVRHRTVKDASFEQLFLFCLKPELLSFAMF